MNSRLFLISLLSGWMWTVSCFKVFYLFVAVFMQSILSAVSSWSLVMYVTQKFHLDYLYSIFFLDIIMFTSFVWCIIEQQGSIYSNSISTEGITIPCYLLFFRFLFGYMDDRNKKDLFICCLLCLAHYKMPRFEFRLCFCLI